MRERRRNRPDIAITQNSNEGAAVVQALDLLKAHEMLRAEDVVVITPNWVQQQTPQTGVVVGPDTLREIIRYVKKRSPQRIVIAAGSGEKSTADIMKASGFEQVIREEAIEFIDLNTGPFVQVPLKHDSPAFTQLNRLFSEMTFLISFTQLKVHQEATMSASIKNMALSWPPAGEHGHPKMNKGIHEKLHGFIRAMVETIPIDLSIISANPAMIGTGPSGGVPVHTGLVVCGTDPVAADTIGARLLGYKPQAVGYLYDCIRSGLGEGNTDNMNIAGLSLVEAEERFSAVAFKQLVSVDRV